MNASIIPQSQDGFQTFEFNGMTVRGRTNEQGNPELVADDVCKALDISNTSQAVSRLPDNEKTIITKTYNGVPVRFLMINEAGLYRLIFRSNKPEAEVFRQKVFDEILPALRKTGLYIDKSLSSLDLAEAMLKTMREQEARLNRLESQTLDVTRSVAEINQRLDDADYYTIRQWCRKQRITATWSVMTRWGKEATKLSRESNIEIKEVAEGMYTVGRYHKSILQIICVPKFKGNGQLPLLDR